MTAPPPHDLFLAHASADRASAEQLFDLLLPDVRAWLDVRSLLPGDEWAVEIPRAQRAALATVVLVSAKVEHAFYLRDEIHSAIALYRAVPDEHRVIAVYLDGFPKDPMMMPYGLRGLHGLDAPAEGGLAGIANKLRATVMTLRGRGPATVPAQPAAPAGPPPPSFDTLFARLCKLTLGGQIDAVILYAGLPFANIRPSNAPLADRAIDIVHLAMQGGPAMTAAIAAAIARVAPWVT